VKLDGDACTPTMTSAAPVRVTVTKRAFTWHVVFYDESDRREISGPNDRRGIVDNKCFFFSRMNVRE